MIKKETTDGRLFLFCKNTKSPTYVTISGISINHYTSYFVISCIYTFVVLICRKNENSHNILIDVTAILHLK